MSRYLDVPEWGTPEQDAERDAQAWVARRAWQAFEVSLEISEGLNRGDSYWRSGDALDVEEILALLESVRRKMVTASFLPQQKENRT